MGTKRRAYTDKFKAKMALDAVRSIKTLAQLAAEYQLHPTQISDWKRRLLDGSSEIFSGSKSHSGRTEEDLTAPLYEEIGRLKMDIKWLEKKL